jgi:hypothetical protein
MFEKHICDNTNADVSTAFVCIIFFATYLFFTKNKKADYKICVVIVMAEKEGFEPSRQFPSLHP